MRLQIWFKGETSGRFEVLEIEGVEKFVDVFDIMSSDETYTATRICSVATSNPDTRRVVAKLPFALIGTQISRASVPQWKII